MTLAIGHAKDDKAVIDLVKEVRPPFSPEAIVEEFVADLARYRVSAIRGGRYGAMWVHRNWSATVVHLAHEIPLRTGLNVATKAVSAKAIDHFSKSPFSNFRSVLGDV